MHIRTFSTTQKPCRTSIPKLLCLNSKIDNILSLWFHIYLRLLACKNELHFLYCTLIKPIHCLNIVSTISLSLLLNVPDCLHLRTTYIITFSCYISYEIHSLFEHNINKYTFPYCYVSLTACLNFTSTAISTPSLLNIVIYICDCVHLTDPYVISISFIKSIHCLNIISTISLFILLDLSLCAFPAMSSVQIVLLISYFPCISPSLHLHLSFTMHVEQRSIKYKRKYTNY